MLPGAAPHPRPSHGVPAFASPLAGLPHLHSVFPLRQKDQKPQKHQKKGGSQEQPQHPEMSTPGLVLAFSDITMMVMSRVVSSTVAPKDAVSSAPEPATTSAHVVYESGFSRKTEPIGCVHGESLSQGICSLDDEKPQGQKAGGPAERWCKLRSRGQQG